MEEEGIFYFFKHSDGEPPDGPHRHTAIHTRTIPYTPAAMYEEVVGAVLEWMRVFDWEKTQEVRSGKCTAWDYASKCPPSISRR